MASNLIAIQDAITAELNELPQDVYETAVPDDKSVQHGPDGLFLPYIVVSYADLQHSPQGRGIVSVRQDAGISFCVVEIYAATSRAARQVADLVRDKLIGLKVNGTSELTPLGGRSYQKVETNAVPKKYVTELAFSFVVSSMVL